MYGPIGLYAVYGVYGHRRGVRLTTYELSICENMYTSIRTPSACVSMSAALSGVLSPEVFSTASGFFSVPSQTRAREKKREKKKKKKKKKKEKKELVRDTSAPAYLTRSRLSN